MRYQRIKEHPPTTPLCYVSKDRGGKPHPTPAYLGLINIEPHIAILISVSIIIMLRNDLKNRHSYRAGGRTRKAKGGYVNILSSYCKEQKTKAGAETELHMRHRKKAE